VSRIEDWRDRERGGGEVPPLKGGDSKGKVGGY